MPKITIRNEKLNTEVSKLGCLIFNYFQLEPNKTVFLVTVSINEQTNSVNYL